MEKPRAGRRNEFGRLEQDLRAIERQVVRDAEAGAVTSRDLNVAADAEASLGERLADTLARVGGSWTFILGFMGFLAFWTLGNVALLGRDEFDPYPFVFLNLILSMLAALQAPLIMMSQNRQATRDRLDAANDYQVNLKAEIEILALHEKLDRLRAREIVTLQAGLERTEALLSRLEQRLDGAR